MTVLPISSLSHLVLASFSTVKTFVKVSVKRHYDHGNTYKEKHLIEAMAYIFRGLIFVVPCGGMKIDMVLEK